MFWHARPFCLLKLLVPFCSECACSEVVQLRVPNLIPCLLSMHSECVLRVESTSPVAVSSCLFFLLASMHKKCLVTNTQTSVPSSKTHPRVSLCLWTFGALDKDAAVSVEFQDLPQPLLGCGHTFFGPLAWEKIRRVFSIITGCWSHWLYFLLLLKLFTIKEEKSFNFYLVSSSFWAYLLKMLLKVIFWKKDENICIANNRLGLFYKDEVPLYCKLFVQIHLS